MNETSQLHSHVQIGERSMRFNGHYNLLNNAMALNPISIEQNFKASVFSRKKLVEVLFLVEQSGFIQGEMIPFRLVFRNPKTLPLHISVHLIQHVKFNASNKRDSVKRKTGILAKMERNDNEHGPEWTWTDNLRIPEDQGPSYVGHYMYNVSYSIQFKVKVLAEVKEFGSFVLKGEAPIYIGTTRASIDHLRATANNSDTPFIGIRRRGSMSSMTSVKSYTSVRTTCSLPPAYSQLSSRIPSWETLPPTYDELELREDTEGEDEIGFEGLSLLASTNSVPKEDSIALCDSK
ncbi:Arrestin domain-containing protein 2, partial [Orchesella cincta]